MQVHPPLVNFMFCFILFFNNPVSPSNAPVYGAISWSKGNLTSVFIQRKRKILNSPSSSYLAPWVGMGSQQLEFWQIDSVQVTTTAIGWCLKWMCYIQEIVFHSVSICSLAVRFFFSPFSPTSFWCSLRALNWGGRLIKMSHLELSAYYHLIEFYFLS